MRGIWILCALFALLVGCDREEQQRGPADKIERPAVKRERGLPSPPQQMPGVERLVDLRGGESPRDYQIAVEQFIRENRDLQVIVGVGWDSGAFAAAPPHKDQLDQVDDFIPIVLFSRDRSALWVNSEALAAAGIDTDTPDPPGGTIEKDEGGLPSGLVRGAAMKLVEKIIPRSGGGGEFEADNPRHD